LIQKIIAHVRDDFHVPRGATLLDVFSGCALGAHDSLLAGYHFVGVELEEKFWTLGQANVALWARKYGSLPGYGRATLLCGDSRYLRTLLQGEAACILSSPPYAESLNTTKQGSPQLEREKNLGRPIAYGCSPGQLGAMSPGRVAAVVSSPPYGTGDSAGAESLQRRTDASAQAMLAAQGWHGGGQVSPDNLATAPPPTFWEAACVILRETFALLRPGGVACFVVKAYVRDGTLVDFPHQWQAVCERVGFVTVHEHHALLTEDYGVQGHLFQEEDTRHQVKRVSFFRRLAERKGSPVIDHETVLCMVKPGEAEGGGVACVLSSPPYQQSDNRGDRSSQERFRAQLVRDGKAHGTLGALMGHDYGSTPGQLGAMPPGSVDVVISSPPYAESPVEGTRGGRMGAGSPGQHWTTKVTEHQHNYGSSPGQLGAMPPGDPHVPRA